MPKNSTTSKKKTLAASRRSRPAVAPPELAALLAYIDHCQADDAISSHSALVAIADGILRSAPHSFGDRIDHPGVFESLIERVRVGDYLDPEVAAHERIALEKMADEEPGVDGKYAYAILISAVTDATVIGAALMYRLLKGGAR